MFNEKQEISEINSTSNSELCFVVENNRIPIIDNKLKVEDNVNIRDDIQKNNYLDPIDNSNFKIKIDKESLNNSIFKESYDSLTQSFWQIIFCPNKHFNASKEKALNLLSYEKMIHNVVELCELKDYIINESSLKYIGNCKLNYQDSI